MAGEGRREGKIYHQKKLTSFKSFNNSYRCPISISMPIMPSACNYHGNGMISCLIAGKKDAQGIHGLTLLWGSLSKKDGSTIAWGTYVCVYACGKRWLVSVYRVMRHYFILHIIYTHCCIFLYAIYLPKWPRTIEQWQYTEYLYLYQNDIK